MDDESKGAYKRFDARTQAANGRPIEFQSISRFLADLKPADYLVRGMLRRGWLYSCTALTGTGKTAFSLLLAKLVAQNERPVFFGPHEVKKGRVLCMAGENSDDVRERLVVDLDNSAGVTVADDAINFLPFIFNIDAAYAGLKSEAERVGGVDLVIVDTTAAYFTAFGKDENSNDEAGPWARILRGLTAIRNNPTVLALAHPTKHVSEPAQLLPRGGGAFLNEIDGNLTLWGDRETRLITLSHNKIRGAEFDSIILRTEVRTSPRVKDSDGILAATVRAVVVGDEEQEIVRKDSRASSDAVMVAMRQHAGASQAELAKVCGWFVGGKEPAKARVRRSQVALKEARLAANDRGDWALTKRGMERADQLIAGAKAAAEARKQF
jgi:hypothetical protein